jgi:hypothetical protein
VCGPGDAHLARAGGAEKKATAVRTGRTHPKRKLGGELAGRPAAKARTRKGHGLTDRGERADVGAGGPRGMGLIRAAPSVAGLLQPQETCSGQVAGRPSP